MGPVRCAPQAILRPTLHWAGDAFIDGQLIDTIIPKRGSSPKERDVSKRREPVWDPTAHPGSWRAVWACSKRRAARNNQTLTARENRAQAVIAGDRGPKATRIVTTHAGDASLDEASIARAKSLAGLKGHRHLSFPHTSWTPPRSSVRITSCGTPGQSFRMSKHGLRRARPIFHHQREAIETHLTVVMAALAIARHLQETTGTSIKRIIRTLKPLQDVTINLTGHHLSAAPRLTDAANDILTQGVGEVGFRGLVGSVV